MCRTNQVFESCAHSEIRRSNIPYYDQIQCTQTFLCKMAKNNTIRVGEKVCGRKSVWNTHLGQKFICEKYWIPILNFLLSQVEFLKISKASPALYSELLTYLTKPSSSYKIFHNLDWLSFLLLIDYNFWLKNFPLWYIRDHSKLPGYLGRILGTSFVKMSNLAHRPYSFLKPFFISQHYTLVKWKPLCIYCVYLVSYPYEIPLTFWPQKLNGFCFWEMESRF